MTSASSWINANLAWRKSSYSADGHGACVEIAWHKSSHSADNGHCVEVASTLGAVRDSKNPAGPMLHANLAALVTTVKSTALAR
jgi:hypothetical protein